MDQRKAKDEVKIFDQSISELVFLFYGIYIGKKVEKSFIRRENNSIHSKEFKKKSTNITTKEYYHKIGYNTRQFALSIYDGEHKDYLTYIDKMPTTQTVVIVVIK